MIRCYLSGNPVHDRVIKAFYEGCPEEKELVEGFIYKPADLAVVFGVYKSKVPVSWPRGEIFRRQRDNNKNVVVLETGYINRGDGLNHHYAAGLNGLNGRADFRNVGMPPDRFQKLQVELKPYGEGDAVILCGQVPWDASVDHVDLVRWLHTVSEEIMWNTKRKLVFRPHPLATLPAPRGWEHSAKPLAEDLNGAHCVVTFNSNSGVEALLAGVPVFAFDKGSMCWDVANKSLADIDSPKKPDREEWANDLAYCQWTIDEMRNGETWRHLLR